MDPVTPPCAGDPGETGDPGFVVAHFDGGPHDGERAEFADDPPPVFEWPAAGGLADFHELTDLVTGDGCPVYHWTGRRQAGAELAIPGTAEQFAAHPLNRNPFTRWWRLLSVIPASAAFILADLWLPGWAAGVIAIAVLIAA